MPYVCPVCGYPDLQDEPRSDATGGSYEICPSCGIQFGLDDEAGGDSARRDELYGDWRQRWIAAKTPWSSVGIKRPSDWDPVAQLARAGGRGRGS